MQKEKKIEKNSDQIGCPIRVVLDRIGGKWYLLILEKLSDDFSIEGTNTLRFNELHKLIGGISQKMLTVSLRTLEADGLVVRKIYPEVPPRVEYSLSELGETLIPHVSKLVEWAHANQNQILTSRKKYKR